MTRTFFLVLCLVLSASPAHAVASASAPRNETSLFIDNIHRMADKKPENLPVLYRETLLQCARNNSAYCQLQLGKEYMHGRVFKRNMERMRYWFGRAAFNDPSYRFELGVCYELGEGGRQDIGLAIKHYNVAASLHSRPEAYYRLGRILEQGKGGIQKNIARAVDNYMLASQLGHAEAAARAGAYLIFGEGVKQDEKKAIPLLEFAATNNDSFGLLLLSVAYTRGMGVEIDLDRAEALALKARDLGEEGAEKHLKKLQTTRALFAYVEKVKREGERGEIARDILAGFQRLHKDPSVGNYENLAALEKAAAAGEADAQFLMGERLHAGGNDGPSEDSIAVQWLRRAAQQGHLYARCRLALLHRNDAAPESLGQLAAQLKESPDASGLSEFFLSQMEGDAALEWQEKSLAKGCVHAAMLLIRQCRREGLEVWYDEIRFLAEAGVPHFQTLQAMLSSTAETQAFLYGKAAEQGYAPAQFELGVRYEFGEGVHKSREQAIFWYSKAAAQGNEDAKNGLERLDAAP